MAQPLALSSPGPPGARPEETHEPSYYSTYYLLLTFVRRRVNPHHAKTAPRHKVGGGYVHQRVYRAAGDGGGMFG